MNTVLALRLTIAAEAHLRPEGRRLITRFYQAYWAEDRDLADPAVLATILTEEGYDAERLLAAAQSTEVKETLRSLTGEAVAAGVFGAPTFVVHHPGRTPSLYWGSDRIELAALSSAGLGRVD
jgi:2-hydroxychromene-2-carboxylate isomerase